MAIRTSYASEVVRIADLAVVDDVLSAMTFEDCLIVGPAVIWVIGESEIVDSYLGGSMTSLYWPLDDGQPAPTGSITFQDTSFRSCRFQSIGFAGDASFGRTMAQSVGEVDTP